MSAPFWVHQNAARQRASMHLATCDYCNGGSGTHNADNRSDDQWHPAASYAEAEQIMDAFGYGDQATNCMVCNPQPESAPAQPEAPPLAADRPTVHGLAISHADASPFQDAGLRSFFQYRHLGIPEATGGAFGAHVIRAIPGDASAQEWHTHTLDFQLVFVTRGWVEFEYEGHGKVMLRAGSSVLQPPGIVHREVRHSDDMELLEVTSPAEFVTTSAEAPQ